MTSGTDDRSTVLKGITHGARDYLLKPVRIQEIKNIWQHVVRKNLFGFGKFVNKNPEDGSAKKKQRLNWTSGLHTKFLNAIHQLGTADCKCLIEKLVV